MRRKIAGTVGSVLLCALLFAGCGGGTASQQQEGETSMAGSVSESQVDIDVSSSQVEFDDEQVQELRTQAEELFEESEYRKSADTAKKAYDLSQNEEDYNSLIKKIIEMLAKNCGFDNPQALRTTNIYGDMEWYLSCDGISGTPLEKPYFPSTPASSSDEPEKKSATSARMDLPRCILFANLAWDSLNTIDIHTIPSGVAS